MRFPITYRVGSAPTRTSHSDRGCLTITDSGISIAGPTPVSCTFDDIQSLDYKNELGLFYIVVKTTEPIYFTPYLFTLWPITLMTVSRNNKVYTELHRRLGGPGRCAKCGYDLRASRLPCPECGASLVSPSP